MSDLALAAGTTKPTLYGRLGTKEEIFDLAVQREARRLQSQLHTTYDAASRQSFATMVEMAMMAFFRFARERPDGYRLLFGASPTAPVTGAGDAILHEVRDHLTRLVRDVLHRTDRDAGRYAELIAAAGIGVARQVCDVAVEQDLDLDAAGALAVAYATAAMRGLDLRTLDGLDG